MEKVIEKQRKKLINMVLENPVAYKRMRVKESLHEFIKYFWSEYSEDEYKDNWHIEYICNELEKIAQRVAKKKPKENDLIINVPPGTSKTSTVMIFFPVWCWVNWYWMRFITGSYGGDLSLESAEYSRDLIRSEKFQQLFPEIDIKQDKDVKSNFRIVKKEQVYTGQLPRVRTGGGRISTSVKGKGTGFHAHIILWDDPLNPKQAASETELENANKWVDHTLSTRKTDKEITVTIGIMQRLHEDDPTGHLLSKKKKNIRHICLPGEILTEGYRELVKPKELLKYYKDGLLDPVRLNLKVLDEMLDDLGTYGYANQVGQNAIPPEGGMFKVDHLQVINQMPASVNIEHTVRYWDKAGTSKEKAKGKGARTAGIKMHKLKTGIYIIEDVKRGQWGSDEREDVIRETAFADTENTFVGVEQEPGSGGKESAEGTVKNLAGFHVTTDRPVGDKVFRADKFSVQVNKGNVYIMRADWNTAFINELRNFPRGMTKDQVDAASGAFAMLTSKKTARVI
jgi:predicted phage terminase large subunit-like protein